MIGRFRMEKRTKSTNRNGLLPVIVWFHLRLFLAARAEKFFCCVTMEPGAGQPGMRIETLRYLAPAPDLNDPGLLGGPHVPNALWEESRGFLDQAPDQIYSMNGSANSGSNQVWRRASMHTMLTRKRMLYSVWSTAECTSHHSACLSVSVCVCVPLIGVP